METFLLGFLLATIITLLALYFAATSWLRLLLGLNKLNPGIPTRSAASSREEKVMHLLDILINLLHLLERKIGLHDYYPKSYDDDRFKLLDGQFLLKPVNEEDEEEPDSRDVSKDQA